MPNITYVYYTGIRMTAADECKVAARYEPTITPSYSAAWYVRHAGLVTSQGLRSFLYSQLSPAWARGESTVKLTLSCLFVFYCHELSDMNPASFCGATWLQSWPQLPYPQQGFKLLPQESCILCLVRLCILYSLLIHFRQKRNMCTGKPNRHLMFLMCKTLHSVCLLLQQDLHLRKWSASASTDI